ncbi:hypothetical protein [Brachybacterium sp. UMB0905]|uniref:hypothetical protein n=1 Tax=Brachybacterium sp. UMB0905 TaxID=2069310 RepID=UPI000C8002F3|nr:hypothetical protein [Brachybacterium sp. UMB0905]PMC76104.1 hypothetical protein CJ197_05500 [Brachybacterium sp. UMB0905]
MTPSSNRVSTARRIVLIILSLLLALALVIVGIMAVAWWQLTARRTTLDEVELGGRTVIVQEVGQAVIFGPSTVRLSLREGRRELSAVELDVANDGKALTPDIWRIEPLDPADGEGEGARVIIRAEEMPETWCMLPVQGEAHCE